MFLSGRPVCDDDRRIACIAPIGRCELDNKATL